MAHLYLLVSWACFPFSSVVSAMGSSSSWPNIMHQFQGLLVIPSSLLCSGEARSLLENFISYSARKLFLTRTWHPRSFSASYLMKPTSNWQVSQQQWGNCTSKHIFSSCFQSVHKDLHFASSNGWLSSQTLALHTARCPCNGPWYSDFKSGCALKFESFIEFYSKFSGSVIKNPSANAGDTDWILGSGTFPGGGNGNLLHILAWETPWTEEPGGL